MPPCARPECRSARRISTASIPIRRISASERGLQPPGRPHSLTPKREDMTVGEEARLGREVKDWAPPPRPGQGAMEGRVVRLEPLNADSHAADLHRAFAGHESLWDYMPYGPFVSAGAYHRWAKEREAAEDPRFF